MKNTIEKIKIHNNFVKEHITFKLLTQLKIFAIIITIICWIAIYDIISWQINFFLVIVWLSLWMAIWLIAWRMSKIFWHPETQKVVSKIDILWVFILLVYIWIEILRNQLFELWIHWPELNVFWLIFLAGLMIWRVLSMIKNIKKVLIEEKKIDKK